MELNWNNDIYLRKISEQIKDKDVISFDIFDTLLFRTVYTPGDVFVEVGKRMQSSSSDRFGFPPEVFAGMRKEADARARKNAWVKTGAEEITLNDIYEEFKLGSDYISRAKDCELAVEQEQVYINPNVTDFMLYCNHLGKRLALVSDTYLSREQIVKLLDYAGFDTSIVDAIIISSEHGVLKNSGKLFQVLLDAFPDISPARVLHIGDNRRSDLDGAILAGIDAGYYGVIPDNVLHPISIEHNSFDAELGELASLRKLAMNTILDQDGLTEDRILFDTGCAVFGTVYTFFAEWVIEQAIQDGINTIITFMREGELLSGLISRAAEKRKLPMKISPVFISRRTTEIVRRGYISGSIIEEYLHRPLLTVGELFSIFYLAVEQSPFHEMARLTIEQCKEEGYFESIRSFLISEPIIKEINNRVLQQKEMLIKYIQSITEGQDTITVDIGFRGTMQDCLSRMNANGKGRFLHLMLMGIPYNNHFLLEGTPLKGWLGYGGENLSLIEKIYRRIQLPEAITNADIGTTIAYRENDGKVIPIFESVAIDDDNKRKKLRIWEGIYHFQDCWFMLNEKKSGILENLLEKKKGFLGILMRFLTMPTYDEALHLSRLYYDESILNSVKSAVCKQNDFLIFDKSGNAEEFIDLCECGVHDEPVYWPEGVVSIREPMYFRTKYLKSIINPQYKKLSRLLLDERLHNKRVVIYGAGQIGRELASMAQYAGLEIACFVDANSKLQNTKIMGLEVISPERSVGEADAYIITPIRFEKEIRERLEELFARHDQKPYILLYE